MRIPADRHVLLNEIAKLPAQQRAVLVLRYYQGLSDSEIAGLLGVAPATVRGYASRALAALRIEFASDSAPWLSPQRSMIGSAGSSSRACSGIRDRRPHRPRQATTAQDQARRCSRVAESDTNLSANRGRRPGAEDQACVGKVGPGSASLLPSHDHRSVTWTASYRAS